MAPRSRLRQSRTSHQPLPSGYRSLYEASSVQQARQTCVKKVAQLRPVPDCRQNINHCNIPVKQASVCSSSSRRSYPVNLPQSSLRGEEHLGDQFFRVRTRQQLTMVMLQLTPNCIFSYVATVVINIHNFMFMDEIFSMFIMSDVLHGRTSRNHGIREKISQAQFPEFGLARHILGIIRYLLLMKSFQKQRK